MVLTKCMKHLEDWPQHRTLSAIRNRHHAMDLQTDTFVLLFSKIGLCKHV